MLVLLDPLLVSIDNQKSVVVLDNSLDPNSAFLDLVAIQQKAVLRQMVVFRQVIRLALNEYERVRV